MELAQAARKTSKGLESDTWEARMEGEPTSELGGWMADWLAVLEAAPEEIRTQGLT